MTTLVEISKRGPRLTPEQKAEQKRQRTQARVGLGSNVLGLTAGAAATGAALRDDRFERGGKIAQGLYRAGQKIPAPIKRLNDRLGNKGRAALAGGALALQAGNMGGDVVANRVLARSAQQGQPVKKAAGKVAGATAATGAVGAAGAAALHHVGQQARAGVHAAQAAEEAISGGAKAVSRRRKAQWLVPVVGGVGLAGGGTLAANRYRNRERVKKDDGERMLDAYISKADHTGGHGSIEKAYRRYDPEADRQRRLGLAAGAGVGGGLLLGSQAARNFTTDVSYKGDKVRGIAVRPKKGKAALLLSGGALASGGLGAYAYRKGLSERNNPWN